jgi:hypothetical protein
MARLFVLHVAEDAAVARQFCKELTEFCAFPVALGQERLPLYVGPGALMAVVWSEHTAHSARAQSLLWLVAINAARSFVICRPELQLPDTLAQLPLGRLSALHLGEDLKAEVRGVFKIAATPALGPGDKPARAEIQRRGSCGASIGEGATVKSAFASGMVRGLASSVAAMGLGGSLTFGVGGGIQSGGLFTTGAAAMPTNMATEESTHISAPADSIFEPFKHSTDSDGFSSNFEQLHEEANALRAAVASDRKYVEAYLADASSSIEQVRRSTDGRIARLEAAASGRIPALVDVAKVEAKPGPGVELVQTADLSRDKVKPAPRGDQASGELWQKAEAVPVVLSKTAEIDDSGKSLI